MTFDPSGVGQKGKLFGFPYTVEEADLVVIPVPWDVTVSYQDGTSQAPELILEESSQLDFSLPNIKDAHQYPVAMLPVPSELHISSKLSRPIASSIIENLENGEESDSVKLLEVNQACKRMVESVRAVSNGTLKSGKIAGTIGGDHSTPLGLIQALAEGETEFGILQIDAHMDLREAYEGFEFSHASIMFNAMKLESITKLVQVGIRDFCEEELEFIRKNDERIVTFFDETCQRKKWKGESWPKQVDTIIDHLPEKVYISFDMDGLDPSLCPHSGTPVPGGLSFYEATFLIEAIVKSDRKIIGFDLSECGAHAWDANVASRILYRLTSAVGVSRGLLSFA